MTSTLPLTLGAFIDRPRLFSRCVSDIFGVTYQNIQNKLNNVVRSVRELLNIEADSE
jgi:hypothetical protein